MVQTTRAAVEVGSSIAGCFHGATLEIVVCSNCSSVLQRSNEHLIAVCELILHTCIHSDCFVMLSM